MTVGRALALAVLAGCMGVHVVAAQAASRVLDSFESVSGWTAHPSDGVSLRISRDSGRTGGAMRLDFNFHGGAGYAIARKTFAIPLPDNYEFAFQVRGSAPPENLEFKLIDSTGDNVWWHDALNFAFSSAWTPVRYRARDIGFAWGPVGGGTLHRVAAIEIVVTAGTGGKGTVWIDDLTFRPLPPERPYTLTPAVSASSALRAHEAMQAADDDSTTAWRSAAGKRQWLAMDFREEREFGGLTIDWVPGAHASEFTVDTSSDGSHWVTAHAVHGGTGRRAYIPLPNAASRWLRIVMQRGASAAGYGVREVRIEPTGWADSANALFRHVAADSPRGSYPRYFTNEQSYWTLVGVSGGLHNGLLSEDGMLESDKGSFSVEPFLFANGRLITWADGAPRQSLARGDLPVPSVRWTAGDLTLTTTAFADGSADTTTLFARYRVRNGAATSTRITLFLAIRPFQVNPPWQFLNVPGGVAPIRSILREGERVIVNGTRQVIPITRPSAFGAATFDAGGIAWRLRLGQVPPATSARDSAGRAAGVLAFALTIPPHGSRDVAIALPFPPADTTRARQDAPAAMSRDSAGVERRLRAVEARWAATLGRVDIQLPPADMDIVRTLRTTLAYMLISRVGPRIQPGTRAYSRSWIRDGALISNALLRLGHADAVRAFARWYAPYQYSSGKVPCCVDARGADPVPENDSNGELIFLIMEYYRYTHDRNFLTGMWPHVASAVAYMDTLRAERLTPEYDGGDPRAYHGLLPQSISHEGYSAKPMHSYWDDFFVLRGFKDAADAAAVLGHTDDAQRIATTRDDFRRDILASIQLAMAAHRIDYIPGSVELGDFDATSTTIAVAPTGELAHLPEPALRRTFERYWQAASRRPDSTTWDAYTPYELRTVGTFVRLGWRDRAQRLLAQFLADRRPAPWNEWAEVVWRVPRTPKFIGDMPHTWIGSDFVRSVLDMFAYDREQDSALVVGAGVTAAWVDAAPGVVVRGLRTPHGTLDMRMHGDGRVVHVRLAGRLSIPRGGIVLVSPYDRAVRDAVVNGQRTAPSATGEIMIRHLPATVVLRY